MFGGCLNGGIDSFIDLIVGIVRIAENQAATVKNVLSGEFLRKWQAEFEHLQGVLQKVDPILKKNCGDDPFKNKSLVEHRELYSKNKISPVAFESSESVLQKRKKNYIFCREKVLNDSGYFGDEPRLRKFIEDTLRGLGVKIGCYNQMGFSAMGCYLAAAVGGGAGGAKALEKFSRLSKIKLNLKSNNTKALKTARQSQMKIKKLYDGKPIEIEQTYRNKPVKVYSYEVSMDLAKSSTKFQLNIPPNRITGKVNARLKKNALEAINSLPVEAFDGLKTLTWSNRGPSKLSQRLSIAGTANNSGHMVIFPLGRTTKRAASEVLAHELGHTLSIHKYHEFFSPGWKKAKKKDGVKVSDYGETTISEDFAEAMRVYLVSDGGTRVPYYANRFRNRFAELDKLMGMPPDLRKQALEAYKQNLQNKGIYLLAGQGGTVYVALKGQ